MMSDLLQFARRTIQEEAQALLRISENMPEQFESVCRLFLKCNGTIILTGIGKSGIIARKWSSTFSSTGTRSYFVNPSEAPHGDMGILKEGDVVVALSFSGESEELIHILRTANQRNISTVIVTGNLNSLLTKHAEHKIEIQIEKEACPLGLAPTTSTTAMMAIGDAFAVTLMRERGFTEKDFAALHPGGALGRRVWTKTSDLMHSGNAIPKVSLHDTFENILIEITQKRLGCAVVTDAQNKILGLITDGDLRRFFQKQNYNNLSGICAKDMMTSNPRTISHKTLATDSREMMEKYSVQQLLVTESEYLVGIIHFHDLLRNRVL